MESKKAASGRRSLVALAYAPAKRDNRNRQEEPLPGPLYDAVVLGLLVLFGFAYFM